MKNKRYINSYAFDITQVSKSYLLELFTHIGEYRDDLILIGGWAPYFIICSNIKEDIEFTHIGSIDIDLAVNPELIVTTPDKYKHFIEYLEELGYENKKSRDNQPIPASFIKAVKGGLDIQIDLLTSQDIELGKGHHHLKVQPELRARRTRGVDFVFDHWFKYNLKGNLPDGGGKNQVEIKIADIVSMIVMKGYVLNQRLDGKDAYDIFSLIKYYKNGFRSCALEFRGYLNNIYIQEVLEIISKKFEKRTSVGPKQVGNFIYPEKLDSEQRDYIITDAWKNLTEFLKLINQ